MLQALCLVLWGHRDERVSLVVDLENSADLEGSSGIEESPRELKEKGRLQEDQPLLRPCILGR